MNTHVFTPCDLKDKAETVFCPMFMEGETWYRDELFSTLEEALRKQKFRKEHSELFNLPEPVLRIVKATFEEI